MPAEWLVLVVVAGCGGAQGPVAPADVPELSAAPTRAQLSARLVELVELGPQGQQAATGALTAWHRAHDVGDELAALATESGLGAAHRGAAAALLADWSDPHAVGAIRALADDGDPTLRDAAFSAAAHLGSSPRSELIASWRAHPDPQVVAWAVAQED